MKKMLFLLSFMILSFFVCINVINPYNIVGDTFAAKYDTLNFFVKNIYKSLNDTLLLKSLWEYRDTFYLQGLYDTFTVMADTSTLLNVYIVNSYEDTFKIGTKNIYIPGETPKIDSIKHSSTLQLGENGSFLLYLSGVDLLDSLKIICINSDKKIISDSSVIFTGSKNYNLHTTDVIKDTGITFFKFCVINVNGLVSDTFTYYDTVKYILPNPYFPDSIIEIPIGINSEIKAVDTMNINDVVYYWHFTNSNFDTITSSPVIKVYYDSLDTMVDTVKLWGMDKFGYSGDTSVLFIIPKYFSYILQKDNFPTMICAKHDTVFDVNIVFAGRDDDSLDVKYYWSIYPQDTLLFDSLLTNDSIIINVKDSVADFKISVYAVVDTFDTTNIITEYPIIRLYKPYFNFSSDTEFVFARDTFSLYPQMLDSNGNIAKWSLLFNNLNDTVKIDSSVLFDTVFLKQDTMNIAGYCVDNDSFISNIDSFTLIVKSSNPYFPNEKTDTSCYVYDSLKISVNANSGKDGLTITKYLWDINGDNIYDDTTVENYYIFCFTDTLDKTVFVNCFNSNNDTAFIKKIISIDVKPGYPVIDNVILIDQNIKYIGNTFNFDLDIQDNEKSIDSILADIDKDGIFDVSFGKDNFDSSYCVSFVINIAGSLSVDFKVIDNRGFESAIFESNIFYVDSGKPVIDSITPLTSWTKDSIMYSFYFSDPNDSVKDIVVNWGDGHLDTILSTYKYSNNGSKTFYHVYNVVNDTFFTIGAKAIDYFSISSENEFTVNILAGKPIIRDIYGDTLDDYYFVKDNRKLFFSVKDTNGYIRRIYTYIDEDTVADKIYTIGGSKSLLDTNISLKFGISDTGRNIIALRVEDEDGIFSEFYYDTIYVRLGAPVVWSDYNDTIWTLVDTGIGYYPLKVNGYDTNGVIINYIWNNSPVLDTSPQYVTDTSVYNKFFDTTDINKFLDMWIYAMDEDSVISGKKFVVVGDSMPPVAEVYGQTVSDSLARIYWRNLDVIDGDSTYVKVVAGKTKSNLQDTILDFTMSYNFPIKNGFYYTEFNPKNYNYSSNFYFSVILKDRWQRTNNSDTTLVIYP